MRIAYGKLGRSFPLTMEQASNVGGDIEVVRMLDALRKKHEVHIIGRNRADTELEGVTNHWMPGGAFFADEMSGLGNKDREPTSPKFKAYSERLGEGVKQLPPMDAWIIWLGQHGTTLSFVPLLQKQTEDGLTRPMLSDMQYSYPIVRMINDLGVKPIWLCPDPRNMIKFRDLFDPNQRPVLAQYNTYKNTVFYNAVTDKIVRKETKYIYSGIELLAVPFDAEKDAWWMNERMNHPPSVPFGQLVNEGYTNLGNKGRLHLILSWTKSLLPYEIVGTWSKDSQAALNMTIAPCALSDVRQTLMRWRSTMTFPATATGWATAKPWECFQAGTVCFKHPSYDDKGLIYSRIHMNPKLYEFLTPPTVTGFNKRVQDLMTDDELWRSIIALQWEYLRESMKRLDHGMQTLNDTLSAVQAERANDSQPVLLS